LKEASLWDRNAGTMSENSVLTTPPLVTATVTATYLWGLASAVCNAALPKTSAGKSDGHGDNGLSLVKTQDCWMFRRNVRWTDSLGVVASRSTLFEKDTLMLQGHALSIMHMHRKLRINATPCMNWPIKTRSHSASLQLRIAELTCEFDAGDSSTTMVREH
jgi:hypothetical protein